MPRIAKYSERMKCAKPRLSYWTEDAKYKYVRPSEGDIRVMRIPDKFLAQTMEISKITFSEATVSDKKTIFDLIEDIVSDTMKSNWTDGNFFNEFVDIKEAPWEI